MELEKDKELYTEEELCKALCAEYDVDADTAKADVAEFIEVLRSKKVID